jgi:hypothetical protein
MRSVNLLKTVSRRKAAKKLRKPRSFRPRVVDLEVRVAPVVGGTFNAGVPQLAAQAGPGTNLDGVVSVSSSGGALGSGSELADQRIILTAGHVITSGGAPRVTKTVTFNLQRGGAAVNIPILEPANAATQVVPAAWTGNVDAGNDIGLVVLRDPNQLIPGVANPANDEMVAPFSPFENGYQVVAAAVPPVQPAPPAAGVNGQTVTFVGYGGIGLGPYGTITQSGIQQINLTGVPAPAAVVAPAASPTFTLTFTPEGGVGVNTRPISANPGFAVGQTLFVVQPAAVPLAAGSGASIAAQFTVQSIDAAGAITGLTLAAGGTFWPTAANPGVAPAMNLANLLPAVIGGAGAALPVFQWMANPANAFGVVSYRMVAAAGTPNFVPVGGSIGTPASVAQNIASALAFVLPNARSSVIVKNNPFPNPAGVNASFVVRFNGNLSATTPTLVGDAAAGGLGGVAVVNNPNNVPAAVALANVRSTSRVKTFGDNTFDMVPAGLPNALESTFKGQGVQLFGGMAVANEATTNPGDSGGPGFITAAGATPGSANKVGTLQIIGITSFGTNGNLANPYRLGIKPGVSSGIGNNSDWGDNAVDTNAFAYMAFIQGVENQAYGAVLDMRDQVVGAGATAAGVALPQDPLTISVFRADAAGDPQPGGLAANPDLVIEVTDRALPQYTGIYFNQPVNTAAGAALITSLTVRGNDGGDTFQLNGNIGLPVTFIGGAGQNTVQYLDQNNAAATTYALTGTAAAGGNPAFTTLTATPNAGGGMAQVVNIYYVSNINVNGTNVANSNFTTTGNLQLANTNQNIVIPTMPTTPPAATFQLQYAAPGGMVTTPSINFNADAAAVQNALNMAVSAAAPGVFPLAGNVQVTGAPGNWNVQFNPGQTIFLPGAPAAGMFQLQFTVPAGLPGGLSPGLAPGLYVVTTPNIPFNASIATLTNALNAAANAAFPNLTPLAGNFIVGGTPGAWTIQLTNVLANTGNLFEPVNFGTLPAAPIVGGLANNAQPFTVTGIANIPGGVNVTSGTVSLLGGNGGNNTFRIGAMGAGNLTDLATTSVIVNGGMGANNKLMINDLAATAARSYTMGAAAGPPPAPPNVFTWGAPSNITFSNTVAVTLNSGNMGNFTVLNALTAAGATINGGTMSDSINVLGTTAGQQTVINAGGGNPAVNVGGTLLGNVPGPRTLNNVKGDVRVTANPAAKATLRVFDLNSAAGQTYTITNSTITRGNGVGTITYNGPSLLSLYAASAGNNMINVQSTFVPTFIATALLSPFTSSPGNTINVGNKGSLVGIQAPVYVTGGGASSNNILNVNAFANRTGGMTSTDAPPSWFPALVGEYSSISIGGSASINYRNTNLSYSLPDTPGLPANVASIQTPYTVDNSALTTIVTGSQGQDAVQFNVTAAGGLGTQTPAVHIDDDAGIATAQFNQGLVFSQQVEFDPDTDVSVTGGSFELNGPVTAADAYVSSGLLTVDAGQTLDVTPGEVVLNGGVTQIAAGAIGDAGDFTQFDASVLGIGLTNGMPTPVTVAGTVSLSGELQLTALAGFAPSSGQVITLIQNNGDSADPGQFRGLPDGAPVVVGNYVFTISYHGGTNGRSVVLTEQSAPPVNFPVANDIQVNMGQGQTAAIDLVRNSFISNGATLTASIVTQPSFGGVSFNAGDGLWDYTPTSASYTGPDSFTYMVSTKGGQQSNVALVTIEVNPVNQAPSGTSNTVTTYENDSYTFTEADFGFSDPNTPPGNFLAVEVTSLPAAGSLTDNGAAVSLDQFVSVTDIDSGSLVFTPGPDESGSPYASFDFAVEDDGSTAYNGQTIDPGPKTMTVDVLFVNQGPVGTSNTVNTLENNPYAFAAADFGFSDPANSPPFSFSGVVITTLPAVGTLTDNGLDVTAGSFVTVADINSGLLVYTPALDSYGTPVDSFTFQVQDDGGTANGGIDTDPIPKTMTIDVTYVNQAPSGADGSVTLDENGSYSFNQADFGFTDPNSPVNTFLAVEITTLPGNGVLTDNGVIVSAGQVVSVSDIDSALLVYTPPANAFGVGYDSFTFQVQNNGGTANGGVDTDPNPKTMTINVLEAESITWNDPADITFGTPLGGTQLDATANVSGTFSYTLADGVTDADGALLPAGPDQMLFATFTPTDTTHFETMTVSVMINVDMLTPAVTGLISSSSPSLGQAVTIAATVATAVPAAGTSTGSVDVTDTTTGNDLGSFPLIGGTAQVTTNELALGNNSITLTYLGNANLAPNATTITTTTVVADYVLSGTANGAVSLSGSASIDLPGVLEINSSSSTALSLAGSASVTASSIQIVGGYHNTGSGGITPTPTHLSSFGDPLAYLPVPSASTTPSTTGLASFGAAIYSSGSHPLSPGIYSEILLEGSASATLMPGLYIIQGGGVIVEGSATITGSGVVFYNTRNPTTGAFGSFLLTSSATLSAPTSGTFAGVLLFQDRSDTKSDEILASTSNSNAAFNLSGTVYASAAPLIIGAKIAIAVDVNTLTLGGTAVQQMPAVIAAQTVYTPAQNRTAAGINTTPLASTGQTIGIVDVDEVTSGTSQSALLSPELVDRVFQEYSVLPNQDFLDDSQPLDYGANALVRQETDLNQAGRAKRVFAWNSKQGWN